MARIPKRSSTEPPQFLVRFPGEIRNKIYEICIISALKAPKIHKVRYNSFPAAPVVHTPSLLKITVLPRWSGPGILRLEGIGALPFLFASKQIHKEIISLLSSMIQGVSIGGYVLQRPGEDPSLRWECAYTLLKARPDVLNFVKNVTVMLPCVREAVFRGRWSELYMKDRGTEVESKPWAMLPGLVAFLRTFKALRFLTIVITADGADPPNFEPLVPLNDIADLAVSMEVVAPHSVASWAVAASPWAGRWIEAWAECLIEHGKI